MCLTSIKPYCPRGGRFSFYAQYGSDMEGSVSIYENCTNDDMITPKPDYHHQNNVINDKFIDTANMSFINDIWIVAEPSEIIIKTSVFLPIALWGILGNSLLIYVVIKNRHIRTPTNLLIANMAVADFLSLLIHPWITIVHDVFQNYELGSFGCKMEGALECTLLLCSVMNLSAISYDRLTAIVLPHETRLTRQSVKIVMVVTWVAGIAISTPLYIYRDYKERKWLDFLEKYCSENTMISNIYWHVIITMMVWVPLTVLLVCYISIFVKLSKYEKVVLRRIKTIQVKYKKKVAKTMFIIVFAFMICRIPVTAQIFYRNQLLKAQEMPSKNNSVQNQVNGIYKILWFTAKLFIFINAAVNPIIYGLMNEKFRKALGNITITKWLFVYIEKTNQPVVEEKKEPHKETKETSLVPSNKSKIFVIYRGVKDNCTNYVQTEKLAEKNSKEESTNL